MPPYEPTPFHEITFACWLSPIRAMPHNAPPVATQLSPNPSTSRLRHSASKLASASCRRKAAIVNSAPLAMIEHSPEAVARFAPLVSLVCPANGRLASVATYCTLTARPAITALKCKVRCTKLGTTANCIPIVM